MIETVPNLWAALNKFQQWLYFILVYVSPRIYITSNKIYCINRNFPLDYCSCFASRSSRPDVLWWKGVLKIRSKFTGEHLCRSAIWIKLPRNFIKITLRHGCSPVNLHHIFRTPLLKTALDDCCDTSPDLRQKILKAASAFAIPVLRW